MAKHDEGVLARWSRLKREQTRASGPGPPEEAPAAEPLPAVPEAGAEAAEAADAVRIEDLPDIESLTYESDFTLFMAKGVPKAIRNRALKKLWRSNPVLANLDGLDDYDLDYRPSEIMALAARGRGSRARHQVAGLRAARRRALRPHPGPAGSGRGSTGRNEGKNREQASAPPRGTRSGSRPNHDDGSRRATGSIGTGRRRAHQAQGARDGA